MTIMYFGVVGTGIRILSPGLGKPTLLRVLEGPGFRVLSPDEP